jgi:hypothetical protein
MRSFVLSLMLLGGSLFASSTVFADEVVVPLPIPHATQDDGYRHDGDRDRDYRARCETRTVHRENDAGDSKTVQSERCD